ncbi:MAG: hypothetical protein ACT4PL_10355 [Phycisphaerales bacterium]
MLTWLTAVPARTFSRRSLRAGALAAGLAAAPLCMAQPEQMTKDDVIAGTMDIQFNTRTMKDSSGDLVADSAALGAKDKYTFKIGVVETLEFSGSIERQPNLFSKILRSKKQSAQLWYNVNLAVRNPKDLKQTRTVGKWVGTVPIDEKLGKYDLAGGRAQDSSLRFDVDAVGSSAAFKDLFAGFLVGKSEKKDNLAEYSYKRLIGTKTVEYKVKKSDPMRFENMQLAKGPAASYPTTIVNGTLNYDYETGNYFADNITFKYSLDGKDYTDVVTGTIKWVEDPDRKTNGKGVYEFNLRFNEDKEKSAPTEANAFDKMSAEDAFFAVDNRVPSLTGKVTYVDTMSAGSEEPSASKVTYALNANKLTKPQVVNFFKLWLVAIGPTNDE